MLRVELSQHLLHPGEFEHADNALAEILQNCLSIRHLDLSTPNFPLTRAALHSSGLQLRGLLGNPWFAQCVKLQYTNDAHVLSTPTFSNIVLINHTIESHNKSNALVTMWNFLNFPNLKYLLLDIRICGCRRSIDFWTNHWQFKLALHVRMTIEFVVIAFRRPSFNVCAVPPSSHFFRHYAFIETARQRLKKVCFQKSAVYVHSDLGIENTGSFAELDFDELDDMGAFTIWRQVCTEFQLGSVVTYKDIANLDSAWVYSTARSEL
jgi:hypothetical protein